MSFRTALTGLNAASTDLGVISNNIANNNTTAFKMSRAEFGDIYSLSDLGTSTRRSIGTGVKLNAVTQIFKQGNLETTGNPLDLAIDGEGFFEVKQVASGAVKNAEGQLIYSRAGGFTIDNQGFIVNSRSERLQGFGTKEINGEISIDIGKPSDLQTDLSQNTPKETTIGSFGLNLNASLSLPEVPIDEFNVNDIRSYGFVSAMPIYDSLGSSYSATVYFAKATLPSISDSTVAPPVVGVAPEGTTSAWYTYFTVDGKNLDGTDLPTSGAMVPSAMLFFDTTGNMIGTAQGSIPAASAGPAVIDDTVAGQRTVTVQTIPADPSVPTPATFSTTTFTNSNSTSVVLRNIRPTKPDPDPSGLRAANDPINGANGGVIIKFDQTTQFGGSSSTNTVTQDGFSTGRLVGVDIGEDGTISGRYSNGQAKIFGQVFLSNFLSTSGLSPIGDTSWAQTSASGSVVRNPPGTSNVGLVRAGALELSNVELSEQLVKMISAQRNFQANAQVVSTSDQMTQTLLNMR